MTAQEHVAMGPDYRPYLLCCSTMLDIPSHYHSKLKLGQQESLDVAHQSLDTSLISALFLRSASAC